MCSYQHTGFVLIETEADPVIMKEHRGAEIFLGSFNCLRVGGGHYFYIYIKVTAKANHHKTSTANKMSHQHIESL